MIFVFLKLKFTGAYRVSTWYQLHDLLNLQPCILPCLRLCPPSQDLHHLLQSRYLRRLPNLPCGHLGAMRWVNSAKYCDNDIVYCDERLDWYHFSSSYPQWESFTYSFSGVVIVHGLYYHCCVTTTIINIQVLDSDVDGFAVPIMLYPKVLPILQLLFREVLFTIEEYLTIWLRVAPICFDVSIVELELFWNYYDYFDPSSASRLSHAAGFHCDFSMSAK